MLNPAGSPGALLAAFREARFELVLSIGLLAEIEEVLARPRIRSRLTVEPGAIESLLSLLEDRSLMVEPVDVPAISRDSDDDLVLATALAGGAEYLVTGDDDVRKDPNVIAHLEQRGVAVLTVAGFLDLLASA